MAKIRNNHTGALSIGGVIINPGRDAEVKGWEDARRVSPIPTWLKLGVIEDVGSKAEEPKPKKDPVAEEKAEMTKAEMTKALEDAGHEVDGRWNKEKIAALYADLIGE